MRVGRCVDVCGLFSLALRFKLKKRHHGDSGQKLYGDLGFSEEELQDFSADIEELVEGSRQIVFDWRRQPLQIPVPHARLCCISGHKVEDVLLSEAAGG